MRDGVKVTVSLVCLTILLVVLAASTAVLLKEALDPMKGDTVTTSTQVTISTPDAVLIPPVSITRP